jgi:hypothetical protein
VGTAQAVAFVAVAGLLLLLGGLALARIGLLRLESPLGIVRDGLPGGAPAPRWERPDTNGAVRGVPSGRRWQLLLFADHSLREFPEVARALTELLAREPELEAFMLSSKRADLAAETAKALELDVPVVGVDADFYWRHNVRVMPFVMVLDPEGRVRAAGLPNDKARLDMVWDRARLAGAAATGDRVAARPAEASR